jgi:hypothetical protein
VKNGKYGGKNGKYGKYGKNGKNGGKNGGATGVIELEAEDGNDVAIILLLVFLVCAVTVKVYAVPFANPETVIGDVVEDPVIEVGEEIATYKLLVPGFPKYAGTVNVTSAEAFPAVADPIVGAVG